MTRIIALAILLIALLAIPTAAGEPTAKVPNLLIDISAAAVNAVVQRGVDRTQPAQEVIQDTPVHGMGRTVGKVSAELVADPHHAAVDVVLRGQVFSKSIGTRPHVLIHTSSTTSLEVRQRVVVDEKGIRILQGPAKAETNTTLLDVTSRAEPDALAARFAEQMFQKSKPHGEAEAAFKTARHAAKSLSDEISPTLVSASKAMGGGITAMKLAGLSLESLSFNTTPGFLQASMRIATPGRSEPKHVPPLPADIDLGLRFHESLLNEVAQAYYGGRSFSLTETNQFYDEVTGGLLHDGRKEDDKKNNLKNLEKILIDMGVKRTTIFLTQQAPLTVAFADQGFTIEIHIASIRQDKMIFAGMRVMGKYRLENTKEGVHLVREGPVRFADLEKTSASGKKLEPQPATFQLYRQVLFGEIMKERITLANLPLPDSISGMRFRAPRAGARAGWFALAWQLDTQPKD